MWKRIALLILIATPLYAASFRATVERVFDGDTIQVRDETGQILRVRISGIDAPERGQPFADRATESLVHLLTFKPVIVDVQGADIYRRLLAKVTCGFGDAGLAQIRAGYAWAYPWADSISEADRQLYAREEHIARISRAGLWSDPDPVPPWQFRREVNQ